MALLCCGSCTERVRRNGWISLCLDSGESVALLRDFVRAAQQTYEAGLRVPYRFVVIQAKQTKKNFLHEVRNVGRSVAHPDRKIPAELLPAAMRRVKRA